MRSVGVIPTACRSSDAPVPHPPHVSEWRIACHMSFWRKPFVPAPFMVPRVVLLRPVDTMHAHCMCITCSRRRGPAKGSCQPPDYSHPRCLVRPVPFLRLKFGTVFADVSRCVPNMRLCNHLSAPPGPSQVHPVMQTASGELEPQQINHISHTTQKLSWR